MLLVLALLWGAFIAYWLKGHAQAGFGDSVGSFRRDLHVLERTAPATMRAANRLRGPHIGQGHRSGYVPSPIQPARPPAGRPGQGRPVSPAVRASYQAGLHQAGLPAAGSAQIRRRQSAKRRRDVLFLLTVVVLATLAMAVATRSHALIGVQVLADLALGAYVALLIRLRNLAAEREVKLSYLSQSRVGPAARRRYAEADLAYADLSLRRAAN